MVTATITLGTLGGVGTFAGQATEALQARYPEFAGDVAYFSSVDATWDALATGAVSSIVLGVETQRTGVSADLPSRLAPADSGLYVLAEVVVPYSCRLMVKAGTKMTDIRKVLGHGSLHQCGRYLDEHLPGIPRFVHPDNSMVAAREVAEGDGTLAVVGTVTTGRLTGLVELARDVDEGARSTWWLISSVPRFSDAPERIVLGGRLGESEHLDEAVCGLRQAGWRLRSPYVASTRQALFEYDVVSVFTGSGSLDGVRNALGGSSAMRIVGAFAA
jgi:prephenate dehydratase